MKKCFFLMAIISSINSIAQDTSKVEPPSKKINHEISVNTTLLLKQIFNLSNTNLPTLPYNLTYKLIYKKSALRVGLGIAINNTSLTTITSSTNQNPGAPDVEVPTTNKSTTLFYRVGWEKRYMVGKKIQVYWGVDFAGQYGKINMQSSDSFNNLPDSYSFTKTTDDTKMASYGGGPVGGVQFFITRRLSIYTEIPVYFQYLHQDEKTINYQNSYNTFSGWVSKTDTQTQKSTNSELNIILPVTLYLAIKF